MTCLGSYETLCFIVTNFVSNYLNAYKLLLFILTVAYEMPPPLRNSDVYLNFTDYQMSHKTLI